MAKQKFTRDGEPICADCGHILDHTDRVMDVDGELVCWDCLKKWAEDDFSLFMDYMTEELRTILYGADIEALAAEHAAEDVYEDMAEDAAVEAYYLGTAI